MTALTDPFLDSHVLRSIADGSVREGVFSIGRNGSSVAMVDQMIRAAMLMERLQERNLLNRNTRVCVVGAGFGGATAAIRAAELGAAKVWLIDKAEVAFERQAKCTTRIIDPTEYHWPYPWFRRARFPLQGHNFPFPISINYSDHSDPQTAKRFAANFDKTFRDEIQRHTNLQFCPETEAVDLQSARGPHSLGLTNLVSGDSRSEEFDLLIFANVIGRERTWVVPDDIYREGVTFRSFDYWSNDQVLGRFRELCSQAEPGKPRPRMLVSGTGDGGLQDFIYYTTGFRSPRQVLDRIEADPSGELLTEIMLSTLQCERMMFWRPGENTYDCQVLGSYHREMLGHARSWLQESVVRKRLLELLETTVDVQLVCSCSHFGATYPLNAFLALAINELYASDDGSRGIRYQHRVRHVGHACGDDCGLSRGEGCLLAQEAQLASNASCLGYAGGSSMPPVTYDMILLRHGIRWRHRKERYSAIDFPVPLWFQDRSARK